MDNESLVKEIQAGHNRDDNLMQLWKQNKPLIDMYLRKFKIDGMTDDDLQQEAFIGMMAAVETYDSDQSKFMTYAKHHIQGKLARAASRCFPAPEHIKVMYHRYRKTISELYSELERNPTTEEVRKRLKVSREEMNLIQRAGMMAKSASLNEPTLEDESELLETIADELDIEELIIERDFKEYLKIIIWEEVDKLNKRTSKIIRLIYQSELTIHEVAAMLKLTPGNVYEIHRKGLKMLNKSELRHLLDSYEFRREAVEFSPYKPNWESAIDYLLDLETDLTKRLLENRRRI